MEQKGGKKNQDERYKNLSERKKDNKEDEKYQRKRIRRIEKQEENENIGGRKCSVASLLLFLRACGSLMHYELQTKTVSTILAMRTWTTCVSYNFFILSIFYVSCCVSIQRQLSVNLLSLNKFFENYEEKKRIS